MIDIYEIKGPEFLTDEVPPCATADPEAFFPQEIEVNGKVVSSKYYDEKSAKKVCANCPYKIDCLVYAMENDVLGIWGGTTEKDRRDLRRRTRATGIPVQLYIK